MLFCEHARDGFIKQPSNSFSNLGFVFAGLLVAWLAYQNKFSGRNRMTTTYFYPIFYASIVILLGIGSFAMHATNGAWGGFFDLMAMFLFSAFVFSYSLMRWFNLSKNTFLVIYLSNVFLGALVLLSPYNRLGFMLTTAEIIFASHLIIGTLIELSNRYIRHHPINATWGLMGVFTLILSFIIWNLSRTQDSLFCDPHSLIQGHAMWHLLDALAAYFVFLYYASEQTKAEI